MNENGVKHEIARLAAFDLVTEPARERALFRKRDQIIDRIADIELDMKLPSWANAPESVLLETDAALLVLAELAEDIDRRIAAAAEIRRALGV